MNFDLVEAVIPVFVINNVRLSTQCDSHLTSLEREEEEF